MAESTTDTQVSDLGNDKNEDLNTEEQTRPSRARRSNSKRISTMAKTAQEGEALLKELGYSEDSPDGGRRRTRSAARGPPVATPPPAKRQKRTSSKTPNEVPATPPQSRGRKGRKKIPVEDTCETANGTSESVKSDEVEGNDIDEGDIKDQSHTDEKMDVDDSEGKVSEEEPIASSESCVEDKVMDKDGTKSPSKVSNGDLKHDDTSKTKEGDDNESKVKPVPNSTEDLPVENDSKKKDDTVENDSPSTNSAKTPPVSTSPFKSEIISEPISKPTHALQDPPVPVPAPKDSLPTESNTHTPANVTSPSKVTSPLSTPLSGEPLKSACMPPTPLVPPSGNVISSQPHAISVQPSIASPISSVVPVPNAPHENACINSPVSSSVSYPVLPQSEASSRQD